MKPVDNSVRIQKYISDCGICSRRAAEREIEQGNVTVNGIPAEIGMKVRPGKDRIEFRGQRIGIKRGTHNVYIMLNKPAGYVTTMSDDKGRKTVADLVSDVGVRLWPVGRLDMGSEGLLLMTNDGELTNLLTHPKHSVPKVYHVRIAEEITKKQLSLLSSPMEIDGYNIMPVECHLISSSEQGSTVEMILFEGRNRQIRKMCEKCNLTVKRLRRISIGNIELDIGRGNWRYLNKDEVDDLRFYCENKQKQRFGTK